MAQNVSLMGASYSNVPAVELPKTGGGTALFADPSITTAIASDVASGKQFLLADGSIGTGTASGGGGGASNIVTGTFKGTTTGTAIDIDLPYSGTGYPIAVLIFVSGGSYAAGAQTGSNENIWQTLIQRYAIGEFVITKSRMAGIPTYNNTDTENYGVTVCIYKSTASSPTQYSRSSEMSSNAYRATDATGSTGSACKIKGNKKLSVYIASTSYGFAANIEYTYYVIYSS